MAYTAAALPTIRLANAAGVSPGSRGAKSWVSWSSSSLGVGQDHREHRVLGVEVEVEAGPGDTGPLADGADGQIGERPLLEQLTDRGDDGLALAVAAAAANLAVGAGWAVMALNLRIAARQNKT